MFCRLTLMLTVLWCMLKHNDVHGCIAERGWLMRPSRIRYELCTSPQFRLLGATIRRPITTRCSLMATSTTLLDLAKPITERQVLRVNGQSLSSLNNTLCSVRHSNHACVHVYYELNPRRCP